MMLNLIKVRFLGGKLDSLGGGGLPLDETLFWVIFAESSKVMIAWWNIILLCIMQIMIFIDHYCTKKFKKIGARPHAMKAPKCLRNRLIFYYHGDGLKAL